MNKYATIRDLAEAALEAESGSFPTESFDPLVRKALDGNLRTADALALRQDWGDNAYVWATVQGSFYDIIDDENVFEVRPPTANHWGDEHLEQRAADAADALVEGFTWIMDDKGSDYWDDVHIKLDKMANGRSGVHMQSEKRAMSELVGFIGGGFSWFANGGVDYWLDVHNNIIRVNSEIDWKSGPPQS